MSPTLPGELPNLSGTLCADKIADGTNKFCNGDHVLEDTAWVGPLRFCIRYGISTGGSIIRIHRTSIDNILPSHLQQ